MNPITVFLTIACLALGAGLGATGHLNAGIAVAIVAIVIASALKMANIWEKFVILRAGKLRSVKGPGLFLILPVVDRVVAVIDERIQTTAFSAEAALTKDTVPVNVDAIIFWFVHDAQKAALNITNYREAIDRVAQTSLREMIGSSMLAALLSERTAADELLRGEAMPPDDYSSIQRVYKHVGSDDSISPSERATLNRAYGEENISREDLAILQKAYGTVGGRPVEQRTECYANGNAPNCDNVPLGWRVTRR